MKTNGKAQVLDRNGEAIPRLYACGGGANTPLGDSYPSCGGCLGNNATMSYIAVKNAMEENSLG